MKKTKDLDIRDYEQDIKAFSIKLMDTKRDWDIIIGIGRGGLIPAVYVSKFLNKPFGVIIAGRYIGDDQEGGKIKISSLAVLPHHCGPKTSILVIDDIADKGITLHAVKDVLKNMFDHVDYAVLYYKPSSTFLPNYYLEKVDNDVWVQFPHEREVI